MMMMMMNRHLTKRVEAQSATVTINTDVEKLLTESYVAWTNSASTLGFL